MNREDFVSYLLKIKISAAEEMYRIQDKFSETNESSYLLLDRLEYDICFIDSLIKNLPTE
jgi:hypothetical protein